MNNASKLLSVLLDELVEIPCDGTVYSLHCSLSITLSSRSCSTETPQPPLEVVSVYSTSAATPWLTDLYACAEFAATISRADDPTAADISLRVGEPEFLTSFAYQIDE
ncbi:MAG: hypothetical protein MZU97_07315 [Bacillus subtilis]|nr:hypothetical protein [Bacillus subtilis]